MSKEIRLTLRDKKGKEVHHITNFVPAQKLIDLFTLEIELKKLEDDAVTASLRRIEFVAGLFDGVKAEDILNGLDARTLVSTVTGIINNVYGFEDEDTEGK